jgi:hypothetical protein
MSAELWNTAVCDTAEYRALVNCFLSLPAKDTSNVASYRYKSIRRRHYAVFDSLKGTNRHFAYGVATHAAPFRQSMCNFEVATGLDVESP